TYMVSKLARDHVTVVLSGDGGDELFAGYTRYVVDRKRGGFERLPKPLREGVMRPLSQRLPHSAWGRNYLHNVSLDPISRNVVQVIASPRRVRQSLAQRPHHSFAQRLRQTLKTTTLSIDYITRVAGKQLVTT